MAIRNTDTLSLLEKHLRAARPRGVEPPPGYTQRVQSRITAHLRRTWWLSLTLSAVLTMLAVLGLALWWSLGGPQFAPMRAFTAAIRALSWLMERLPWLEGVLLVAWASAVFQALGAGWWLRRYCRRRPCIRSFPRTQPHLRPQEVRQ